MALAGLLRGSLGILQGISLYGCLQTLRPVIICPNWRVMPCAGSSGRGCSLGIGVDLFG